MDTLFLSLITALLFSQATAIAGSLPAKVIYHAGDRANLIEDIQAGTVPQEAWDKYIMGDQTNFDLPPFRRGLYGSEAANLVGMYGAQLIGTGKIPWIMAIVIKQECLNDARVYDLSTQINDDSVFSKWVKNQEINAQQPALYQECASDGQYWNVGPAYLLHSLSAEDQAKALRCDATFEQFLAEKNYGILWDYAYDSSWYIRDRSCIETIRGTADDIFRELFTTKQSVFSNSDEGPDGWGQYSVLLQTLAEATLLKAGSIPILEKKIQEMAQANDDVFYTTFDMSDNGGIATRVLVTAALNAIKSNTVKDFQKKLLLHEKSLFARDELLASGKCRDPRGLSSQDREACDHAIITKRNVFVAPFLKAIATISFKISDKP